MESGIKPFTLVYGKTIIWVVKKASDQIMDALGSGMAPKDAFDKKAGLLLSKAARLHSIKITFTFFEKKILTLKDGPIKTAFQRLCWLLCIDQIFEHSNLFVLADSIDSTNLVHLKEIYEQLLEEIHPDAFKLAEDWHIPDILLDSTIGHSNGNVYENLYNSAKKFGA